MNAAMAAGSQRITRRLALVAVGLVVVQLLLLEHPGYAGHIIDSAPSKLLYFAFFGAVAFLIWLLTEVRWPLIAWAAVLLVSAIDETQQTQFPSRSASMADFAPERAADPFLVPKR
jgi:VanZ family protein